MVSLAYIFVLVLMVSGVFLIDYYLLHKAIEDMYFIVMIFHDGTQRMWVLSALLFGFILSIITDLKERKKKQATGSSNG